MSAGLRAEGLQHARAGPFSVAVPPGFCLAVTGPSGAGKSLLLRMVADLIPHHGEAWLGGVARSSMPAPEWRRQVAYGAAEPGWWRERVGEHFAVLPVAEAERLGLPADVFARRVEECSTGERARLALLRLLALRPAVLLLDEPTGALDGEAVRAAEALIAESLRSGVGAILVTHSPEQAERLGTGRAEVRAGRLWASA
ncbi:MAG: ATP-binding cassette domain-containing protein [Acetobacteraceae bacterium]|nr:ATP-binding cassette domain-containing protein [Acetobacteraceae bacterium]